ncbi:MAG: hypothetical protein JNN08_06720 [Bryobacterales bacterium]|nr:hypothetical protein [Bryobacterales bacterium]
MNLVYGVRYQQLRGNRAAARHDAARAMAEFDKLPAALRERVGTNPALQLVRLLHAFAMDGGDVHSKEGVALLNAVADASRQADSRLLESALSQLVPIHAAAGRREEVTRLCGIAEEWLVPPYRAGVECPGFAQMEAEDRRDPSATSAIELIDALRVSLRENPQHFGSRMEMARAHATLAERYGSRGRLGAAKAALRDAESAATQLLEFDPAGPLVRRLAARVATIKRNLAAHR